jgi:hypothetical protein
MWIKPNVACLKGFGLSHILCISWVSVMASVDLNFEYIRYKKYLSQPQMYIYTNSLSNTTYIPTTAVYLGFSEHI